MTTSARTLCRAAALLAVVLAALAQSQACLAAQSLNVLFIGNSHTYVNDMPNVFRSIAVSAGKTSPRVSSSTIGGYCLYDHLENTSTLSAIDNGLGSSHLPWDFVVLQEHSAFPSYAEVSTYYRDLFQGASLALYDRVKVHNPNARVVIFETPAWNQAYFDTNGDAYMGYSAIEMQARVRKWCADTAYAYIPANSVSASKSDAVVAPIGDAWERNYLDPRKINLHNADYYHPLYSGTYLGALVMYATVYDAKPQGIGFRGSLSPTTANYLQGIAAATVPEPGPAVVLLSGVAGLFTLRRRR